MRSLIVAMLLVVGAAVGSEASSASIQPGSGCLPTDSLALQLKDEVIDLMSRSDQTSNDIIAAEGIVRVPVAQIALVSDTTTCRRAADAYGVAVNQTNPDRLVHSLKVGIRYVVVDPSYDNGGYKAGITFDSSFTQVFSRFAY